MLPAFVLDDCRWELSFEWLFPSSLIIIYASLLERSIQTGWQWFIQSKYKRNKMMYFWRLTMFCSRSGVVVLLPGCLLMEIGLWAVVTDLLDQKSWTFYQVVHLLPALLSQGHWDIDAADVACFTWICSVCGQNDPCCAAWELLVLISFSDN